MADNWYIVDIETEGSGLEEASDEAIERLSDALYKRALEHQGFRDKKSQDIIGAVLPEGEFLFVAPVVSWGGVGGGPSVRVSVLASNELEAAERAKEVFEDCLDEAGLAPRAIARVDVMTESYQDSWLAQEPEELVGVAEIASILGVSRQRVSELRGRRGFPNPVADLASGPVWRLSSLQRFITDWPRRPGRPNTRKARLEELEQLAEAASSDDVDTVIGGRGLTLRERDVLALVAAGRSLEEIADRLGVKDKTLDSHLRSMVAKIHSSAGARRSSA